MATAKKDTPTDGPDIPEMPPGMVGISPEDWLAGQLWNEQMKAITDERLAMERARAAAAAVAAVDDTSEGG